MSVGIAALKVVAGSAWPPAAPAPAPAAAATWGSGGGAPGGGGGADGDVSAEGVLDARGLRPRRDGSDGRGAARGQAIVQLLRSSLLWASRNGRMEGINRKIKTMLRQFYGLRDDDFLRLKLYALHESKHKLVG